MKISLLFLSLFLFISCEQVEEESDANVSSRAGQALVTGKDFIAPKELDLMRNLCDSMEYGHEFSERNVGGILNFNIDLVDYGCNFLNTNGDIALQLRLQSGEYELNPIDISSPMAGYVFFNYATYSGRENEDDVFRIHQMCERVKANANSIDRVVQDGNKRYAFYGRDCSNGSKRYTCLDIDWGIKDRNNNYIKTLFYGLKVYVNRNENEGMTVEYKKTSYCNVSEKKKVITKAVLK